MPKPQYFRWNPAEAEADEDWRMMDVDRIGLFVVLLNYGWNNNGLPVNPVDIWRAIPLKIEKDRFEYLFRGIIEHKFPVDGDRRRNKRQERERQLAEGVSLKRAEAARSKYKKTLDSVTANAEQLPSNSNKVLHEQNVIDYRLKIKDLSSDTEESARGTVDGPGKPFGYKLEFETNFWPHCWLKVGKGDAERAYIKQRTAGHSAELICDAATKQGPSLIKAASLRGSSVLHPATWLNQQRFLDEGYADDVPKAAVNTNGHRDYRAERKAREDEQFRDLMVDKAKQRGIV